MKTTVSIPDKVFARVERLAKRTKRSRSRIFSDALDEYLARHTNDEITERMNTVLAQEPEAGDAFVAAAARSVFEPSDW